MRRTSFVAIGLLASWIAGCGGSGDSPVSGKILWEGTPYGTTDELDVMITLVEVDSKQEFGRQYPTLVQKDGEFLIKGPDGLGIPRGKYKITLSAIPSVAPPPPPKPKKGAKKVEPPPPPSDGGDKLNGAFTLERTPWVVDVGSGTNRFTFDVMKPKLD